MEYSKLAGSLTPSPIREMMKKAAKMNDVISFSVGEPDFLPQPSVMLAAKEAIDKSTKYAPGAGLDELRAVYVDYLNETIKSDYQFDNVAITTGGMAALYLSLFCLVNPGDEVLLSAPYFTNYGPEVEMVNAVPVCVDVDEENDFVITPEAIEKAITPKTKVIMLNSPCNPTGSVIEADVLEEIAKIAIKYDLFVISDEVYRHILFDNQVYTSIATFPGMKERTLIVDSCSKSCAMTGFRVGFATGPEDLINLIIQTTENVYSCTPTISQYAACEALKNGNDYREYMLTEYQKRRDYVYQQIQKIDKLSCCKPKGAFYAFVNIKDTGLNAVEFCNQLLETKHVALVPGNTFSNNANYHVRLAYATSMENIVEGLARIEEFVKELG